MHMNKIRIADDNGLAPAGIYFARLAGTLREANARDAAAIEKAEERERKLEARYRRDKAAPPVRGVFDQHVVT